MIGSSNHSLLDYKRYRWAGYAEVWQVSATHYEFCEMLNVEVMQWLEEDCVWDFVIFSDYFRICHITFSQLNGALEFKLRFVD